MGVDTKAYYLLLEVKAIKATVLSTVISCTTPPYGAIVLCTLIMIKPCVEYRCTMSSILQS